MLQKVKDIYSESIQIQISASSLLSENIANAAQMVMQCLLSGHKVIACGSGRSHANAQLLVANLLNRYDLARPSFPSVLLDLNGAIGNALIFEKAQGTLYQHQFNAIAMPGDLLLAFAPLGSEKTVEKELRVVALTGANNDTIQGILAAEDLQIAVPATKESRILENHLFVINALCELVDLSLFPSA